MLAINLLIVFFNNESFSDSMVGQKCGGTCVNGEFKGCVRGTSAGGSGCHYAPKFMTCYQDYGTSCENGIPITKNGNCTGIGSGNCTPDDNGKVETGYCISSCLLFGVKCSCAYTGFVTGTYTATYWRCKN